LFRRYERRLSVSVCHLYPHNFPNYFDMLLLLFSLNCEAAGRLGLECFDLRAANEYTGRQSPA
jgi:hypothetical protein